MRYEARHTNGYWKLFDKHQYTDIDIFERQIEAEAEAAKMNAADGYGPDLKR